MLKNFLQIKKMIALLLTFVFCYLAIMGTITSEQFLTVFSLVIAFYFGQSTARQAAEENKQAFIQATPIVPEIINPTGTITNTENI